MPVFFLRTRLLLLLLLFLVSGAYAAESNRLTGRILDLAGVPVEAASITLEGTSFGAYSRMDGSFVITGVPAGSWNLLVTHLNFEPVRKQVVFSSDGGALDLGTLVLHPAVTNLPEATYTATRSSVNPADVPRATAQVNAAEIRYHQSQSTAEVLRETPGVMIQKTSHGGGHAIVRGLTSNRVLLLVDGIRLNNSTYRLGNHPYLTFVDPLAVDQLDLVRGPGSVLYGSDALGGTINLRTRSAPFSADGLTVSGEATGGYRSADEEVLGHGSVSLSSSLWSLFVNGGYSSRDDLRRGEGGDAVMDPDPPVTQSPTGFDAGYAMGTFKWRFTDAGLLTLSHQYTERPEVPRYDKYVNGGDYRWLYSDQTRQLSYASVDSRVGLPWLRSVHGKLSYQLQTEGRSIQGTPDDDRVDEVDDTGTVGVDLSGEWEAGRFEGAYGFDLYHDNVSSESETITPDGAVTQASRGRYPDGATYTSTGIFAQQQAHLTQALIVQAGLRYSLFSTAFDTPGELPFDSVDLEFNALTASAGLVYQLLPSASVYTSAAQGFRAPNLGDMAKLGESKGTTFEVPNPDLDPEEVVTVELGTRVQSSRLTLDASLFYTSLTNTIAGVPATWNGADTVAVAGQTFDVRTRANTGEAYIYGVEWGSRVQLPANLQWRATVTYAYGQNTTLDEPFDGIQPLTGYTGLVYMHPSRGLIVEPYVRFALQQDRLSSDDLEDSRIPEGGTPGWYTLNVRSQLRIDEHFTLNLALENLLDRNYRVHASGINAPGRQVVVSLRLLTGQIEL
ncbi:TonB-dependent receptor [bacterium]|nr:TonB-dependent receptor [bacterium]